MKNFGFGLMRLPLLNADDHSAVDIEAVKQMADAFLANGFTYFDTAAPYHNGNSETAFCEAVVKRYPRSAYTITDKLTTEMIRKQKDMQPFFNAQLKRLGLEYVDYYWLHGLNESTYHRSEQLHAFEFIKKLKEEGKVRHIGLSYHDKASVLDQILTEHPELEYVQLQLNYLDWNDEVVQSQKCYEVAKKHGKPVIVMEPVKGGSLVNIPPQAENIFKAVNPQLSTASWAIRFAASNENVMMVLSGMNTKAQLEDNMSFMKDFSPLDSREQAAVRQAAEVIKGSIAIACTGCRYCVDDCPQKIEIPQCFAIYNNLKRFGDEQLSVAKVYYGNIILSHGKASDCLKCGKCESHCPQHLPIRDYLTQVAQAIE